MRCSGDASSGLPRCLPSSGSPRQASGAASSSRCSRRSAAAYGSSSWRATASHIAGHRGTRRGGEAAADALHEDRATCASARRRRAAGVSPVWPCARWRSRAASSSGTPSPVAAVVTSTSGRLGRRPTRVGDLAGGGRHEHRPELRRRPLGTGTVALVDDDDVRHLEQPGLDRLDLVAHLGRLEHDGRVGGRGDLDLALARAHGLEEDDIEPGGSRTRRQRRPTWRRARQHGHALPSSG